MVAVTLDGEARSLELPPDCFSAADAASYAKRRLGAAWAAASPASNSHHMARFGIRLFELSEVWGKCTGPIKKRLFLSAKGWQPGGGVPEDACLLCFAHPSSSAALKGGLPSQDELPAFLLRGGKHQLHAFSAERAQVTIDLPTGRAIVLPVSDATCSSDMAAYIASMLGCDRATVRLWCSGNVPLGEGDRAVPGHHYRAEVAPGLGLGTEEMFVKTLTGKTITLHFNLEWLVLEMKEAVFELEGIPVDQQRMIFGGQELDDHRTLSSYGISACSTVHMVLRLRGGMYTASSGRLGDFEELGLDADEDQVAAMAASRRMPLEIVLPDGSSVLLGCKDLDQSQQILAALREHLAAAAAEAAVLSANVDELQDVTAMRDMLRHAQAALRRRQP